MNHATFHKHAKKDALTRQFTNVVCIKERQSLCANSENEKRRSRQDFFATTKVCPRNYRYYHSVPSLPSYSEDSYMKMPNSHKNTVLVNDVGVLREREAVDAMLQIIAQQTTILPVVGRNVDQGSAI